MIRKLSSKLSWLKYLHCLTWYDFLFRLSLVEKQGNHFVVRTSAIHCTPDWCKFPWAAKRRLRTQLIWCSDAHIGILIAELDECLTLLAPPLISSHVIILRTAYILATTISMGMLLGTVGQAVYRMVKYFGKYAVGPVFWTIPKPKPEASTETLMQSCWVLLEVSSTFPQASNFYLPAATVVHLSFEEA